MAGSCTSDVRRFAGFGSAVNANPASSTKALHPCHPWRQRFHCLPTTVPVNISHPRANFALLAYCTATVEKATEDFTWKGSDEFSSLGDRQDLTPEPLPNITRPKRIVLVRHGQSTWNAEGRVQGSTDFSILTAKGVAQAETTREMLKNDKFDTLFHSPLKRAAKTASIIWGSRQGNVVVMPSLREIDLYSFQGLLKHEGKAKYGEQYSLWQKKASEFEIDSQAPVRQVPPLPPQKFTESTIPQRRSLCSSQSTTGRHNLQPKQEGLLKGRRPDDILGRKDVSSALVAAHNAVNQALVATAVGFPPSMFRRMLQSNGATTVLDFTPVAGGPPTVTINRLNQSPGPPFGTEAFFKPGAGRLVLIRAGATEGPEGRLLGRSEQGLSTLGQVQAQKAAELLMDIKVDSVMSSPLRRAKDTATPIAELQTLAGNSAPPISTQEGLVDRFWGSFEGRLVQEVRDQDRCNQAESLTQFEGRTLEALQEICKLSHSGNGKTVAVVAHSAVISALICHCLGLPEVEDSLSLFRTDAGSITVIDLPDPEEPTFGVARCVNYTAHLGRWAIPVTREDLDSEKVCGIDGCF